MPLLASSPRPLCVYDPYFTLFNLYLTSLEGKNGLNEALISHLRVNPSLPIQIEG